MVRRWASTPPEWLDIHPPTPSSIDFPPKLDAGERDAITLALHLKTPVLIIDEMAGRRVAQDLGLRVIGTLGILRDAHRAKLLDLKSAVADLQATNFHIAADTLQEILGGLDQGVT